MGQPEPKGMIDSSRTSRPRQPIGLVTKAMSNFCEVRLDGEQVLCQFRGRLRSSAAGILTGDRVLVERLPDGHGLVAEVLPRRTELIRPPVANVDCCIVVLTTQAPPLNLDLVDRILILAQDAGLDIVICLNKLDLSRQEQTQLVAAAYGASGWPLIMTSAIDGTNLESLAGQFEGRVAVLSGQSGVGKSTLLNAISPGLGLAMGEVSAKGQRGRHTTRVVELLWVAGGWVADSPGFVRLDLPAIEPVKLAGYYPEMGPYSGQCRFADCIHDAEPGCAVKEAVAAGEINGGRYQRYVGFLHELQARRRY